MEHQNVQEYLKRIQQIHDASDLQQLKAELFGKKGILSSQLAQLSKMDLEQRKKVGAVVNAARDTLLEALAQRHKELEDQKWRDKLSSEKIDITLPAAFRPKGRFHPLNEVLMQILEIFYTLGFSVYEGPDIETSFYNFDALNVPVGHPARAEQDTFYLSQHLLRTQTSPVQIRTLQKEGVPLRMVASGRVYRSDDLDQTHTPMFHQMEGLVVDRTTTMAELKGCLSAFLRLFFGCDIHLRFRPSFFPFTEPSAEVDVGYVMKDGSICVEASFDKPDKWMEILGCGMVHPHVLRSCGLDPLQVQGYAFGVGLERLTMLKYGITDIRALYRNDQRWLSSLSPKEIQSQSLWA